MGVISRRKFLEVAGATTLASTRASGVSAAVAPRVVVIGGGFGGATVSKYLRLWGRKVNVSMVEPGSIHYSCILSNGVLTGDYGLNRITLEYDALKNRYGVEQIQGTAGAIDPVTKLVSVATSQGNRKLPYDKLVIAPGVDFIKPAGNYDESDFPHAWKAGPQTILLKNKLNDMKNGGVFALRIPKAPYRCPPGPYERACVIADYLQRNKPQSKVIVLDENPKIIAEAVTFGDAFKNLYADILEYHTNVEIYNVESSTGVLNTNKGKIIADVVNFIPDHRAGRILGQNSLIDDPSGRWAQINPLTYSSIMHPDIHVVGDSQATGQPKSGHMANAQTKVCADAIVRYFDGEAPNPQPSTSSACYSPVSRDKAGWLSVVFQYDQGSGQMKVVPESFAEADRVTKDNYEEMFSWAGNLFADSFY